MKNADDIKLLILTIRFPSHIQTWLLNWIEQTLKHNIKITIVAYGGDTSDVPRKVDTLSLLNNTYYYQTGTLLKILRGMNVYFPGKNRRAKLAWLGLRRLILSNRTLSFSQWIKAIVKTPLIGGRDFDLVHSHSLIASYEYLPIFETADVPLITTFHGPTPPGVPFLSREKLSEVFEYGTVFLVNTGFASKQLESMGCPPEKIVILPQGTQIRDFPYYVREEKSRLTILTVGRFQRDKGHRYALQAIAKLIHSGNDIEYRMVGTGPERDNLLEYANELGIQKYVSAVGPLVDEALLREYQRADIFLLPSLNNEGGITVETQGVVLQEAQACGCLVVATRTGGIPEVLDDGKSAWVVEDRNSDAIAQKISWLMENKDKWETWRHDARHWVESNFDSDLLGNRLVELYKHVVGSR